MFIFLLYLFYIYLKHLKMSVFLQNIVETNVSYLLFYISGISSVLICPISKVILRGMYLFIIYEMFKS